MENGNKLFVAKTFWLTFLSAVLRGFSCVINQKKSLLKRRKNICNSKVQSFIETVLKLFFFSFTLLTVLAYYGYVTSFTEKLERVC